MTIPQQNSRTSPSASTTHNSHVQGTELRKVFGAFPSGVVAVCALADGEAIGMAVSTFTPVSLDPPLVSICIQNTSSTWPLLRQASAIGVSVLGADDEPAARQLSSKAGDRFAGLATVTRSTGAVHLAEACAFFDCVVEKEILAGDHLIAVLRVIYNRQDELRKPLVFHSSKFRQLAEI